MSAYIPRSFILKFVVLLVAALLPLGVLLAVEVLNPPPAPQQKANRVAAEVDRLLKLRMSEVFTLAALPSARAYAASDPTDRVTRAPVAMNELQAFVTSDTEVREAFIVDTQGNALLGTGDAVKTTWGARTFVKRALAGQLDASPIVHEMNEFSQYYSAPILDNRGDIAGALVSRVAAQELWAVVNGAGDAASGEYAVLVDENGVRLADGGDMARNLVALAPLGADVQSRILQEQTYGTQVTVIRTTQFSRAQEIVSKGAPEGLQPGDLGVRALAIRRLSTRPWVVLYVLTPPSLRDWLIRLLPPVLAAIVVVGLVALWLTQ